MKKREYSKFNLHTLVAQWSIIFLMFQKKNRFDIPHASKYMYRKNPIRLTTNYTYETYTCYWFKLIGNDTVSLHIIIDKENIKFYNILHIITIES